MWKAATTRSRHNCLQRAREHADLHWRWGDIFTVGIDRQRRIGCKRQAAYRHILNLGHQQVRTGENSWRFPQQPQSAGAANEAKVKQAVFELGMGGNPQAASIGGSVRESNQRGWARAFERIAICELRSHPRVCRPEAQNREERCQQISAATSQPARHFVSQLVGRGIEPRASYAAIQGLPAIASGDLAKVNSAYVVMRFDEAL